MRLSRDDRGQTLVVVALLLTMLLGFVGLAVDVAWYELNLIRMQRAADAAALAGVVYLPGNPTAANNAALQRSTPASTRTGIRTSWSFHLALPGARSGSTIRSSARPAAGPRPRSSVSGWRTSGTASPRRGASPPSSSSGT